MKSGASQTQPAETILAAVFCAALAALDLSGYPAALLPNLVVADINPIYFTLMLNQWFLIAAGLLGLHFLCPHWALGLKPEPFTKGLRAFWPSAAGMLAVSALGFSLGLLGQYNNRPSAARVLVEGLLYYVSVAVLEELYVRGLLLRLIETLCAKRRFAQQAAVMLSAVLFGAGHLPGMMGQSGAVIVCRLLWTISLGVYLGALYLRSGSLWLPILVHMLIDFCATPFTFVKEPVYTLPMVASVAAGYFVIAAWEFYRCLLRKEPARTNKAPLP